jgi:hypothetical protein
VNEVSIFHPPRRFGLIFQGTMILALLAGGGWGLWQAANANIGPIFLLYLLPALVALGFIPVGAYSFYALRGAWYQLEREGIRLHWGLRSEDIPMTAVHWVRPAEELGRRPGAPRLHLPGAVLGMRRRTGFGEVEYLAARATGLVFIATPKRLYAISPDDPASFLKAYQRLTELGSLSPMAPKSIYPTFLLARVWTARPARYLILAGLVLSLALLAWASLAIPTRTQISLGFEPNGSRRDAIPAVRLLLLPVLNAIMFLVDFILGLFFFRDDARYPLAYFLWASGAFTPLLFVIGMFFILRQG